MTGTQSVRIGSCAARWCLLSSRQHGAKPRPELAEIKAVDDAVAVEVEIAQIIRIAGCRAEGVPEEAEIEAVDSLVAIDIAEHTVQTLRVIEDVVARHLLSV